VRLPASDIGDGSKGERSMGTEHIQNNRSHTVAIGRAKSAREARRHKAAVNAGTESERRSGR